MGAVATIALVVLGIAFMIFVAFFGRLPALRRTPIAWLHRFIWVHVPAGVLALDQRVSSGRVTSSCARFGTYIMYDKHPLVLIFYFLLLSVGEILYLPTAWPQLGAVHRAAGTVAMALPYVFLYLAAFSDPGTVTSENHGAEMSRYPYDFALFHPGAVCATCRRLKPARSKHCSVCRRCVARADHHCIFINNCVGARNTHWFVLLLASTGALTLYGGVLGLSLMAAKTTARYPAWRLAPWRSGAGMDFADWLVCWGWGLQDGVAMGAVTLLALLTSPLVWGLLGYHVWLVYCGTTTNESMKWSDWQAEMDEGFAFKRAMAPAGQRAKDLRVEPAWTRWPAEAEQILVRTESGQPPRHPAGGQDPLPGVGEWEPVWRLKDVENLYDIGFWDNMVDVFFPNFSFRDIHEPVAEDNARRRVRKNKGTMGDEPEPLRNY
ncbi:DHHC palmitoyltransferase-domain-containing protein [Lasiosphaeria miniovina]|uniref:Palmitoyltransferase n=1 Tax=Lasiosphaeria miniovina TaxID=1954250 RepID=A0AA40BFF6_9PEZI|nr:DHHC palmitoyltransferase-domain-containing protein [Lasiosphaeria miniovina]KAK0733240.1 DHHC palmitoyltransferase-domain-containing protein [Lasiosphaeria miniovina]